MIDVTKQATRNKADKITTSRRSIRSTIPPSDLIKSEYPAAISHPRSCRPPTDRAILLLLVLLLLLLLLQCLITSTPLLSAGHCW